MEKRIEQLAQLFAVLILMLGCFLVLKPFLVATMMAAVVCISSWPVYEWLLRKFKGRKNWAATTMTFALVLVVILPLALVAYSLSDNVMAIYVFISDLIQRGPMEPPAWVATLPMVGGALHDYWHTLASNHEEMAALTHKILEPTKDILIASGILLGQGVAEMSLASFVCFFFYRNGVEFMQFIEGVMLRVVGTRAKEVVTIINNTVRSVMYGLLGTSLAQGIIATIGFALAGVPAALLLGFATAMLALLPVGPPLIWGGASIWLFSQGEVGWSFFMLLWGAILISGVDNMLLPLLLSRGSQLPFILLLLGVMGGVFAFGFVGIFIGPTLLAVGLNLMQKWIVRDEGIEKKPGA
jgi:predicted PurR-regulated permease PerM